MEKFKSLINEQTEAGLPTFNLRIYAEDLQHNVDSKTMRVNYSQVVSKEIKAVCENEVMTNLPIVYALLLEIADGKGRFSRDPLEHAGNCIADMRGLALEALTLLSGKEGEHVDRWVDFSKV